jgi:hypothetical protein
MIIVSSEEIEKAKKELQLAIDRGFIASEAVFKYFMVENSSSLRVCFDGIICKAHPTDGNLNWGRNGVHQWNYFENGELHPLDESVFDDDEG